MWSVESDLGRSYLRRVRNVHRRCRSALNRRRRCAVDLLLVLVTLEYLLALGGVGLVDEVTEFLLSGFQLSLSLADILRVGKTLDLALCTPDLTLQGTLFLLQLVPAL